MPGDRLRLEIPRAMEISGPAFRAWLQAVNETLDQAWPRLAGGPVGSRVALPGLDVRFFADNTPPLTLALTAVVRPQGVVLLLEIVPVEDAPPPVLPPDPPRRERRERVITDRLVAGHFHGHGGGAPPITLAGAGDVRVQLAGDLGDGEVRLRLSRGGGDFAGAFAPGEDGSIGRSIVWRAPVDTMLPAAWFRTGDRLSLAFACDHVAGAFDYLLEETGDAEAAG